MQMRDQLMPIPALDFTREGALSFHLYVHLPKLQKIVLYRRKGSAVDVEKLESMQSDNLVEFLIEKGSYEHYLQHVSSRIQQLISTPNTPEISQELARLCRHLIRSAVYNTSSANFQLMIQSLNDVSAKVIQGLLSQSPTPQKRLYDNFLKLAKSGSNFQKHPVNVMTLSLLIATGIGYTDPETLADLSMSALVHDLGLVRLPIKVIQFSHRPSELGMADRQLLFQHPKLSLEILESKEIYLSRRAQNIILQHHEEANGFGYPAGLSEKDIEPLAHVLMFADAMDAIIADAPEAKDVFTRVQAVCVQFRKNKSLSINLLNQIEKLLI